MNEIGGKSLHGGDMDSEIGNVEAGSGDQVGTCAADRERVALLQQVAACAPKEWRARFDCYEGIAGVWISAPTFPCELRLDNDNLDANAIILMLDRMENAGEPTNLYRVLPAGSCEDVGYPNGYLWGNPPFPVAEPPEWCCMLMPTGDRETYFAGPTRAWAVASAFVAVFGKASQNGCGKEPPASTPIPESPSPTVEDKS